MAPVPEECLVMVPPQEQAPQTSPLELAVMPEVSEVAEPSEAPTELPPSGRVISHLPPQVSLPPELAAKLERQDSCESVGSLEDEDIQADDASLEGPDVSELEPRSERSASVVSDGSEEGGRDSGIEAEREPDMVVPEDDLMARIVAQVEFYFSDASVAKDKFLLKHIRRNKEGYVSLKLVSSFKKVKQLTKDWRVVAHSLGKLSTKIQINDAGSKIRRTEPLPDFEDTPATCAVLALALPLDKPSIQSVSELFGACGDIAFIRVLRAGTAVPQDLKALSAKHPQLAEANCAWVEFEAPESAKAALELSNEDGMKVVPILPEAKKKEEKQPQQPQQKGSQPNSRKNSTSGTQQAKGPGSRKNSIVQGKGRKNSSSGSGSDGETAQYMRQPRRKCVSLPQTQSPNLRELSAVVEARRNRPKSKSCTEFPTGSPPMSWVQRHLLAAAAASAASAAAPVGSARPTFVRPERVSQGSLPLPEGVLRFPKGPDGSRGFARRRTSIVEESS
ncbi:la-related protein 6-like [Penaeus japonicus]|uniref:la-related protein 6-like n=1 Tax=Penaeus japonicus TaxID=27405 RepID=UPI001C710CA9|nr:la-related protein 6-like [Penaeus japonicus]